MTQEPTPNAGEKKPEPIIAQLGRLARSGIAPEEYFKAFLSLAAAGLAAESGILWLHNSEDRQLVPKVKFAPPGGPIEGVSDDVLSNVAYRTIEQKMPVLYFPEGEGGETAQALGGMSFLAVPVEVDAKTSVVVFLARKASEDRRYTPQDVHALQGLCAYLTVYFAEMQLRHSASVSERMAKLADVESDLGGAMELEKMAFILANRSKELVFFDRTFVAFPRGRGFHIAAVSGVDDVQQQGAVVQNLRDLTSAVARIGGDWHFTAGYLEKVEDETLHHVLTLYFKTSDYKSILFMRVEDDSGLLAIAGFERREEKAYSPADFQFVKAFAKASAKALRRAHDFGSLPGIALAKGAHRIKKRALGAGRVKFFAKIAFAVAVAAVLVFARMDFSVKGECRLHPYLTTVAAPRINGTVKEILRTQGDLVDKNEVIAVLDERDIEGRIRTVELEIRESDSRVAALRTRDTTSWNIEKLKLAVLKSHLEALLVEKQSLDVVSPQRGVITTPVDEINASLDSFVQAGKPICRVADTSKLYVEMEVAERDIRFVDTGQELLFVLKGSPGEFHNATVDMISPTARQLFGKNVFIVRGIIDNSDGAFRLGHTGTAVVPVGKRSMIYVVFRSTIDWLRTKLM